MVYLAFIISNGMFFLLWLLMFLIEVRRTIRQKYPRIYNIIFMCGGKRDPTADLEDPDKPK